MKKKSTIQDDDREKYICDYLDLIRQDDLPASMRIGKKREGIDALHRDGYPFEVKSGGRETISTARGVNPKKIEQWRSCYWIFAKIINYEDYFDMIRLVVCHPNHLEPFFKEREKRFYTKEKILEEIIEKYEISNSYDVSFLKKYCKKGFEENDPGLSWKIISSGSYLDIKNKQTAIKQLDNFICQFPLDCKFVKKQEKIDIFND